MSKPDLEQAQPTQQRQSDFLKAVFSKLVPPAHLRWWKSWNSGEGSNGRWYPQWEMVVLNRARQYHRLVVVRWEPRITGPISTGSVLESCSREERHTHG